MAQLFCHKVLNIFGEVLVHVEPVEFIECLASVPGSFHAGFSELLLAMGVLALGPVLAEALPGELGTQAGFVQVWLGLKLVLARTLTAPLFPRTLCILLYSPPLAALAVLRVGKGAMGAFVTPARLVELASARPLVKTEPLTKGYPRREKERERERESERLQICRS